jgi:hypothetical protein
MPLGDERILARWKDRIALVAGAGHAEAGSARLRAVRCFSYDILRLRIAASGPHTLLDALAFRGFRFGSSGLHGER